MTIVGWLICGLITYGLLIYAVLRLGDVTSDADNQTERQFQKFKMGRDD